MESLSNIVPNTLDPYLSQAKGIIAEEKSQQGVFGRWFSRDTLPDKIEAVDNLRTSWQENNQKLQQAHLDGDNDKVTKYERKQLKLARRLVTHELELVDDLRVFFASRGSQSGMNIQEGLDQAKQSLKMASHKVVEETYDFTAKQVVLKIIENVGSQDSSTKTTFKLSENSLVKGLQNRRLSPLEKLEYEILGLDRELVALDKHLKTEMPTEQRTLLENHKLEWLQRKIVLEDEIVETLESALKRAQPPLDELEAKFQKYSDDFAQDLIEIKPLVQQADERRIAANLVTMVKNLDVSVANRLLMVGIEPDQLEDVKDLMTDVDQRSLAVQAASFRSHALDNFLRTEILPDGTPFPLTDEHRKLLEDKKFKWQADLVNQQANLLEVIEYAREDALEALKDVEEDAQEILRANITSLNELEQANSPVHERDRDALYGLVEGFYRTRGELKARQMIENSALANDDTGPAEPGGSAPFGALDRLNLQILECEVQIELLSAATKADPPPSAVKLGVIQDRIVKLLDHKLELTRDAAHQIDASLSAAKSSPEQMPEAQLAQLKDLRKEYKDMRRRDAAELERLQEHREEFAAAEGVKPVIRSAQDRWKHTKWGDILLRQDEKASGIISDMKKGAARLLKQDFESSVDAKQAFIRTTKAELAVLNENLRVTENALATKRVLAPGERLELQTEKARLEGEIRQATDASTEAKIALHATFLQRVIDKTGNASYDRNRLVGQREAKRLEVEADSKILQESQQAANPVDALGNAIPMDSQQRQALQAAAAQNETNYAAHVQEMRGLDNRIDRLDKDLRVLRDAYIEQIQEYAILQPPQRTFLQLATAAASNEALRYLTAGFYGGDVYVTPDEFRTREKFATAGYCLAAAWEEWGKWQGNNLASMITSQVNDFLQWADRHPTEAAQMATDVVLTINLLQDAAVKDTLLAAVNTKIYASALLGSLESEKKDLVIERSDFKFKALADVVRYGPTASAGVKAVGAAASQLMEGNLLGALTHGAVTFANQRYRAEAVQRAVDAMNTQTATAASAGLSLMRGDSMQQIISAQAGMQVLRLAGEARRALRSPIPFMGNLLTRLALPFRQIVNAKTWTERGVRAIAVVGPAVLAVAAVTVPAGLVFAGSLTLLPAVGVALAALAAVAVVGVLTGIILNYVFPMTYQRIKVADAVNVAHSKPYRERLDVQAADHLKNLKAQCLIPVAEPRPLDEEPATIQDWLKTPTSPIFGLSEAMAKRLDEECERRLRPKQQVAGTSIGTALEVREYVDVFKRIATEEGVKELIAEGAVLIPPLTLQEQDVVRARLNAQVLEKVTNDWLATKIRQGMENEFILEYNTYKTPGQFARDQQAKFDAVTVKQAQERERILRDLNDEATRQHLAMRDVQALRGAAESELNKRMAAAPAA